MVSAFSAALHGEEGLLINVGGMYKHWREGIACRSPHVPLVLSGRFKQRVGIKLCVQHLYMVLASVIANYKWIERILDEYHRNGIKPGPTFCTVTKKGKVKRAIIGDLDLLFHGSCTSSRQSSLE